MGLRLSGIFFATQTQTQQTEIVGGQSSRCSTRSVRPVKLTKVRKKILLRADFFKNSCNKSDSGLFEYSRKKTTTQNEIFNTKKYNFHEV